MRKSILALTVVLVAGSVAQTTAEARGGRGGFGAAFSPVFGRHSGADPSILERAEYARQQQAARARAEYAYERRREAMAAAARAASAAKAAKAQQAVEKKALRQEKVTARPMKPIQVIKAPVVVPTATAAGLAAPASHEAARPATGGECKRFIPAAGVTITVPCTE